MKGTGFDCANAVAMANSTNGQTKRATFMAAPGRNYIPAGRREHSIRYKVAAHVQAVILIGPQRLFLVQLGQKIS